MLHTVTRSGAHILLSGSLNMTTFEISEEIDVKMEFSSGCFQIEVCRGNLDSALVWPMMLIYCHNPVFLSILCLFHSTVSNFGYLIKLLLHSKIIFYAIPFYSLINKNKYVCIQYVYGSAVDLTNKEIVSVQYKLKFMIVVHHKTWLLESIFGYSARAAHVLNR